VASSEGGRRFPEEPHLAGDVSSAALAERKSHDEARVCADDCCDPGRCSAGIGATATPARAAGPGQRQLGPPASYQANHPALTTVAARAQQPAATLRYRAPADGWHFNQNVRTAAQADQDIRWTIVAPARRRAATSYSDRAIGRQRGTADHLSGSRPSRALPDRKGTTAGWREW
jgi:hypothetical protein